MSQDCLFVRLSNLYYSFQISVSYSFSVVGVVKGVITSIIGFFTFGGVRPTPLTVSGVALNAAGGILYTYIKYRERKRIFKDAQESLPVYNKHAGSKS